SDKQSICPGDTIHYSFEGYGTPQSIQWTFPGGSPASSSDRQPVVVYPSIGEFRVGLEISNSGGTIVIDTPWIKVNSQPGVLLEEGFEKTSTWPPSGWLMVSDKVHVWKQSTKAGSASPRSA